ncbi:host specificity factor TipJ family phage tail protein [Halopseudomonas laoshanensis]|uniref:host specificity factor TipJ family phage tail protein n=1 Tax=Halopseudomonas laoshanensis TaxID=2268758 RepID=UPI0037366F86
MIKFYPTHLHPSAPLLTLPVKGKTIAQSLKRIAPDFAMDKYHRFSLKLDGVPVPEAAWPTTQVTEDSALDLYPKVGDPVTALYIVVAVVAVAALYMAMNIPEPGSGPGQGDDIPLRGAMGNRVRLGDPVRELLGRDRVFPDYIMPPIQRFEGRRSIVTTMTLCVGVGRYLKPVSTMRVGDTPFSIYGPDIDYAFYEPGESLAGDPRAIIWAPCGEVGTTDAGTQGLDLAATAPSSTGVIADALVLAGNVVTLAGADPAFPESWGVGTIVTLITPSTYQITAVAGYDRIAGELSGLDPYVGMPVSLIDDVEYDLVVASYSPYVAPVPGVGGSPSEVVASAAPASYDYSEETANWSVTFQGETRAISLAADYGTMSGLVAEITAQLSGMRLVAQDQSGRLRIVEPSSPYQGGVLSQTGAPSAVFGPSPTYTVGTASAGGTPEQQAFITLNNAGGGPFTGLPQGSQRLALGFRDHLYRITALEDYNATVERLTDTLAIDADWPGFEGRTLLDFTLQSDQASAINWIGPYLLCPPEETTDMIEFEIFFPQGLAYYKSSGSRRAWGVTVEFQWRDAAISGSEWQSVPRHYVDSTENAIGFTNAVAVPAGSRPLGRWRRVQGQGGSKVRDTVYVKSARCRLASPASYPGVTIMTLSIRGGDRLAAQSNRMISLVAERIYDEGEARSIKGAYLCVTDSLGIPRSRVDVEQLNALEAAYWGPRGERYDFAHVKQMSARDVLQQICAAGMGHQTYSGSLISAIREGVQPVRGTITPHELTGELVSNFITPGPDDFNGVDVKYRNGTTFTEEIMVCRLPGLEATKVDTVTIDGVTDPVIAWRIGMRILRKHQGSRWHYTGETEMDAQAYEYLDHVLLADDVPHTTITALIEGAELDEVADLYLLEVGEPLDWSVTAPRAIIRRHDGTATQLFTPVRGSSDYQVFVPAAVIDFELLTDDPHIEQARLLFGPSSKVGYPAMMSLIKPGSDGSTRFEAEQYSEYFYADDNNVPA